MKLEKKDKSWQAAATNCDQALVDINGLKTTTLQIINEKTGKLMAKGMNRSMDKRIENFDLALGEK